MPSTCQVNDCQAVATCRGTVALSGSLGRAESVLMCPTCVDAYGLPRSAKPLVKGTDTKGRQPVRATAQAYANSFPCVHRSGPPVAAKCVQCGDRDRMTQVWQCAIHGRCTVEGTGTLEGEAAKLQACVACEERREELE